MVGLVLWVACTVVVAAVAEGRGQAGLLVPVVLVRTAS
jgi:hypothetical protein